MENSALQKSTNNKKLGNKFGKLKGKGVIDDAKNLEALDMTIIDESNESEDGLSFGEDTQNIISRR